MIRTFIAIEIDERIKRKLQDDLIGLRAAAPRIKWVKPDNLHLTLRFLGDVKENDLQELFDALQDDISGCEMFELEYRGVGVFPHWRHPRVAWAGCGSGAEQAGNLAAAIEQTVTDLGYGGEKRQFNPHLTIGRVKLPADADGLESAVAAMGERRYGVQEVEAVVVYMSTLRRTGPVYAPMCRIELA